MDLTLYKDVNRLAVHTGWAHPILRAYAVYGVGVFAVLVLAAWWFGRRSPDAPRAVAAAVWTAAGTLIALAVNQPVASAVHRARPFTVVRNAEVLVARSHDFSFPSDHAITAAAAATGLWITARYAGRAVRALAVAGTVLALALAFARVYVGAHYPGDVAAGLALGAAIGLAGWALLSQPLTRLAAFLATRHPWGLMVTRGPAGQAA
jgi:membrane-associated phospholipid phosphatase